MGFLIEFIFIFVLLQVNFKDYLKRYPEAKVTDDKQPMLISKLKPRKNERVVEGEGERLAALVPECCYITGLTEDQKQNFKVMTDLAASTRIVPAQRVTNLDKFISRILGKLCYLKLQLFIFNASFFKVIND